jgi:hypothetical protein
VQRNVSETVCSEEERVSGLLALDACRFTGAADGFRFQQQQLVRSDQRLVNRVYPDVRVRNEGTIVLFTPLTPAARDWICVNVQPNAQWLANALVVEHRYAADLAAAMRQAGLVLG